MFNAPNFCRRKVGGIWFIRLWRIRVSFCLARIIDEPMEVTDNGYSGIPQHDGRLTLY